MLIQSGFIFLPVKKEKNTFESIYLRSNSLLMIQKNFLILTLFVDILICTYFLSKWDWLVNTSYIKSIIIPSIFQDYGFTLNMCYSIPIKNLSTVFIGNIQIRPN